MNGLPTNYRLQPDGCSVGSNVGISVDIVVDIKVGLFVGSFVGFGVMDCNSARR